MSTDLPEGWIAHDGLGCPRDGCHRREPCPPHIFFFRCEYEDDIEVVPAVSLDDKLAAAVSALERIRMLWVTFVSTGDEYDDGYEEGLADARQIAADTLDKLRSE